MSKSLSKKFKAGMEFQKRVDALSTAIDVLGQDERFCEVVDTLSEMHNKLIRQVIEVERK